MNIKAKGFLENLRLYFFIVVNLFVVIVIFSMYTGLEEISVFGSTKYGWFYKSRELYLTYITLVNIFFALCIVFSIKFYIKKRYIGAFLIAFLPFVWGIVRHCLPI